MTKLEKAFLLAMFCHDGQYDKAGKPYIFHPVYVALLCNTEEEKIVALLHDTVEDTNLKIEDIKNLFGSKIATAVQMLTHKKDEDYFIYIARISGNPLAKAVKIADLTHNMMIDRIKQIGRASCRERVLPTV